MVYNLDTKPFWKSLVDDIATVEDISKKLPWFLECNPDRFPYWWVKMIKFPFHSYFEYPSMCDFTVSYTGGLNIFQSYSLFPSHIPIIFPQPRMNPIFAGLANWIPGMSNWLLQCTVGQKKIQSHWSPRMTSSGDNKKKLNYKLGLV